jgi:hypothetical protein
MCDGVSTLRHILVGEIAICDHDIIYPEDHWPPCAKGGKLCIIDTAHVICYIYTTYVVIVVINSERNHYLCLLQITKDCPGLLHVGDLLPWPLSEPVLRRFKVMNSTVNCNWYIVKPQMCTNQLAKQALLNGKYFQGMILTFPNIWFWNFDFWWKII